MGGGTAGGSSVTGHGAPDRPDPCIKVYDCGTDKICYNGDDQIIGHGGTNGAGIFTITLTRPLVGGEEIYVQDDCAAGGSVRGPITVVSVPAGVPALSSSMIVVLAAFLSLVGVFGLARALRHR